MLRNVFKRWFRKTEAQEVRLAKPHLAISFDESQLHLYDTRTGEVGFTIRWHNVVRIEAFKRDLFMMDCICIAIHCSNGFTYEIDEEMTNYNELTSKLHIFLPGCVPYEEWFSQVAFPAFATNLTEIFHRKQY